MARVNSAHKLHIEHNNTITILIGDAARTVHKVRVLNLTHVLNTAPEEMNQISAERHAQIERFNQLRTQVFNLAEPDLRPSVGAFFAQAQAFIDMSNRTINLSASGHKVEATQWFHDMVTPAYNAAEEASSLVWNEIKRRNDQYLEKIQQMNGTLVITLASGTVLGLLLAFLAFLLGLKRVLKPIGHLTEGARRVSAGDLDVVLDASGRDEVSLMTGTFNEMIRNQRRRIDELHGLLEVSEIVSSSLDLPTVLKWILTSGYLLGAEEGVILLSEPGGTKVRIALNDSLKLCECALRYTEGAGPLHTAIGRSDDECDNCLAALGFRHALSIPMRTHRQVGSLIFLSRKESLTPHEVELATILGNQAAVAIDNARLYCSLWGNYRNMIFALANAVGAKSNLTHRHSERLVKYGELVGARLGLPPADVELVREGCLLHDVGKIGISEVILNKPGRLTPKELEEIQKHPLIGSTIISSPTPTERLWEMGPMTTQDPTEFLKYLSVAVRHHHERYDGKGYPDGLKGEEIPLAARIVAVVDAYEAMTSERPYRKAMPVHDVIQELRRCAGTQFDPQVVEAFISVIIEQAETGKETYESPQAS